MIKSLSISHFPLWKATRLEAVTLHPDSFGESLADVEKQDEAYFAKSLENAVILAYFADGEIAGLIGCYRYIGHNLRHKGVVFGIYVKEKYRGQGIAAKLLEAIEQYAQRDLGVKQLQLHVTTENKKAFALYEKQGYSVYGIEPKSLLINNRFYDDHLMVKFL